MKIKVNYGETINMGNYETKRIDLSMEYEIPNEANSAEHFKATFDYLKGLLQNLKQQ